MNRLMVSKFHMHGCHTNSLKKSPLRPTDIYCLIFPLVVTDNTGKLLINVKTSICKVLKCVT